jgi:Mlc titration factor MtfA (ptsG expression regulator)
MGMFILSLLGLACVLGLLGYPRWQAWRRQRWARQPFPPAWRGILRRRVPLVARLPVQRQLQLKQRMLVFLAEVPILGCAGLRVRDEMRVSIAAQACLLLLGRPEPMFAGLRQVLLYPGGFWVEKTQADAAGVIHPHRVPQAGEYRADCRVVLSWEDARHGAALADDGYNVVLHEFAHQLQQSGARPLSGPPGPDDAPAPPAHAPQHAAWAQVMQAEYLACCQRCEAGEPGLLDPYAASAPEEFFAVSTEVFFERPQALLAERPALYAALALMYGQEPAQW